MTKLNFDVLCIEYKTATGNKIDSKNKEDMALLLNFALIKSMEGLKTSIDSQSKLSFD